MPLDGSVIETKVVSLRAAMFDVRLPNTKIVGYPNHVAFMGGRMVPPEVRAFVQPVTRREVMSLVCLCSDHSRLMAQNAHLVPVSGCYDREFKENDTLYFSPHGFIDYYIREALGAYKGCQQSLKEDALIYLRFIERQHRSIHKLRRKAYEQECEFKMLLDEA
jgi:hypothetical protein